MSIESGAFSLVEVTLALGVCSFCLLAVFGLISVGLRSNKAALEQTAANGILTAVAADLRATRKPSQTEINQNSPVSSQQYGVSIPVNPTSNTASSSTLYFTSDGQFTSALNGSTASGNATQSRYLLTISFLASGTNAKMATCAQLQITWPAAVTSANAEGSVQTFVALDRN